MFSYTWSNVFAQRHNPTLRVESCYGLPSDRPSNIRAREQGTYSDEHSRIITINNQLRP
jgi:hypothetical protein